MQKRSSGRWERFKSLRQSESIGYIRIGIDEWLRVEGVVPVERKEKGEEGVEEGVEANKGKRGSRRGRGMNRVLPTYAAGVLRETGRKTPHQQFGSTVVGGILEPYRGTRSQERKRMIKKQGRPGKIEFRRGQPRDGRRGVYKNRLRQQEHQLVYEGAELERRRISRERIEPEMTPERWALRERGYRESGKRELRKAVRARNWVEYNAIRVVEKTRVEEVERWILSKRSIQNGRNVSGNYVPKGSEEKLCGRKDHRNRAQGEGEGRVERRVTGEYGGERERNESGESREREPQRTEEWDWVRYKRGEWLQRDTRAAESGSEEGRGRREGPTGRERRKIRVGREGRYGSMGKDGREWIEKFRGELEGIMKEEKGKVKPRRRQMDESLKRLLWWGGRTREGGAALVGTRGRDRARDVGSTESTRRGYTGRCETTVLGIPRTMFWEGEEARRQTVKKGRKVRVGSDREVVRELKARMGDPVKDVRFGEARTTWTEGLREQLQKEKVEVKKGRGKVVGERFVKPKGRALVKARRIQMTGGKKSESGRRGKKSKEGK